MRLREGGLVFAKKWLIVNAQVSEAWGKCKGVNRGTKSNDRQSSKTKQRQSREYP